MIVSTITVGELRAMLREYRDHVEITFGATLNGTPLEFYRVKSRGDDLVQIELNERPPEDEV
ncbi:hypothetical protein WMC41_09910 [Shinella yambaruensis]|uniref:hypothetical protein n=1 Tax=Shinella yambaruensis TaxID=415996 RepID=UPI003D7BABC9